MEYQVMVSIRCLVYNQAQYVRRCLDGFVMQRTNFKFEAVVHDDASNDGTTDIIREYSLKYPDIIKPIYEECNQYSKHDGSIQRIMDSHMRGKYVAICEGDDYWIDPYKLQKEVDFLEANPEYGLIHTYFNYVDIYDKIIPPPTPFYQELNKRIFDGYIWDYYLVNPGFILTCTCMYRASIYQSDERFFLDHGLFMMIARRSKVYCLREITAAYRRTPTGAMVSSHDYYVKLESRARLYQLYYFTKKREKDIYNTILAKKRICIAYLRLLFAMRKFNRQDRNKMLYILRSIPITILFYMPISICYYVSKKLQKQLL